MKLILDFDDVLFDTSVFKNKIFNGLLKYGVSSEKISELYKKHRDYFNLENLYKEAIALNNLSITDNEIKLICDEVMSGLSPFIDKDLLNVIQTVDIENCFVVTAGNQETQMLKVVNSKILNHIKNDNVFIVQNNKNEAIKTICEKFTNEKILFIDDKKNNIDRAESLNLPNLQTVLFDDQGKFKLYKELNKQNEQLPSEPSKDLMRVR